MSFPSGSVDINLLQAAQLDFAFSRQLAGLVSESLQLGSSERDARNLSCLLYGRKGFMNLASFKDFLKLF